MTSIQDFVNSLPNLANGAPESYSVVHVATGLDDMWKKIPPATILPNPADIRDHLRVVSAIYADRLARGGEAQDKALAMGTVLAAARFAIDASWDITTAKIITNQTITPADVHYDNTLAGRLRCTDADAADLYDLLLPAYVEDDIISKLMMCGQAMYATCGAIIVKSSNKHHFVAPHKVVSTCVLRQVFGRDYVPPLGLTKAEFEDVMCHKVPHVYTSANMVAVARDVASIPRLKAAGLSTAAVRIPATYPPESAAGAVRTLIIKAVSCGNSANVAMNTQGVLNDLDNVRIDGIGTPQQISALEDQMAHFVSQNKYSIARCCGLIRGAAEGSSVSAPPIFRAYSIKSIEEECDMEVVEGKMQMAAALRAARERNRRGIVPGMGLFGAAPPADTDPLPADEVMAQVLAAVIGNNAAAAGPVN